MKKHGMWCGMMYTLIPGILNEKTRDVIWYVGGMVYGKTWGVEWYSSGMVSWMYSA